MNPSENKEDLLIRNIRGLVQVRSSDDLLLRGKEMATLPVLSDAWLSVRNGKISDYGTMDTVPSPASGRVIDASGCFVFPSFVDSHTHLVFPTTREDEFVLKIRGATYADIARQGGGILNSARKLAETSEDQLFESALKRMNEIAATGTGAVEIKSGYGLTTEAELKMLRVARRLQAVSPLGIRTTFLGAHAVPAGVSRPDYVRLIIDEMIPAVAAEGLADFIDVFCEDGFFSPEETIQILLAGREAGMIPKVHANQLGLSGGVQAAASAGAISADHLEHVGPGEIETLERSGVIPVVLPGAAFFLNLPMTSARQILSADLPLAIASDYNPGSSPSGNMSMMISLACIAMRLTPEEAINAATINGAAAMAVGSEFGSITRGKVASLFITRPIPSIAYLPYSYGSQLVDRVILRGVELPPVR